MEQVNQAVRMNNVHYAIRGPLLDAAQKLEKEGRKIYKLNIGNTGAFNFDIDPRIQEYVIQNFGKAGGYSDSSGIAEARLAIRDSTLFRMKYPDFTRVHRPGMRNV